MGEEVISIDDVLKTIKKHIILIIILTLVGTIVAASISLFLIKPRYTAGTKVFIGKIEGDNQTYSQSDVQMYQKLMMTYAETIKSRDLIEASLNDISATVTPEEVLANLTINAVNDTQILKISYEGTSPEEVKDVIEAVTEKFIEKSQKLVSNGNIKVVETVEIPDSPSSPNKIRNTAIGFLLGLILGIVMSFVVDFFNNTYKDKEVLEKEISIPVLGTIPKV